MLGSTVSFGISICNWYLKTNVTASVVQPRPLITKLYSANPSQGGCAYM